MQNTPKYKPALITYESPSQNQQGTVDVANMSPLLKEQ